MRPILFTLGGVPFASWYVFFGLAGVLAFALAQGLLSRAQRSESTRDSARAAEAFPMLFALCYVFGWLGARAFSIAREQVDVTGAAAFFGELMVLGPMTFYGGALAAFAVGLAFALFRRLPVGLLADACLPAASLGLALGRVGCHLNGDDFGLPVPTQANPPSWSVVFPNLGDGVARYPVQLEEALFSFLVAGLGAAAFLKVHAPNSSKGAWPLHAGVIAGVTAAVSAAHRFANEFYRGDPRGTFWGSSLTTSQGLALLIFFAGVFLVGWLSTQRARRARTDS